MIVNMETKELVDFVSMMMLVFNLDEKKVEDIVRSYNKIKSSLYGDEWIYFLVAVKESLKSSDLDLHASIVTNTVLFEIPSVKAKIIETFVDKYKKTYIV